MILYSSLVCLFALCATAQLPENTRVPAQSRDPVSAFFSEVGDLFLDIDEAIGRYTAPKVDVENKEAKAHSDRRKYFSRVRENYQTLQSRLGESLKIPDLLSSNLDNANKDSSLPTNMKPSAVPWSLHLSSNAEKPKEQTKEAESFTYPTETINSLRLPKIQLPRLTSSFKLDEVELKMDSKPSDSLLPDVSITLQQNRPQNSDIKSNDHMPEKEATFSKTLKENDKIAAADKPVESSYSSRKGPAVQEDIETPEISGRILGDVLFSESVFDKLVRRAIKDHGKWALDPQLFPSKLEDKPKNNQKLSMRDEDMNQIDFSEGFSDISQPKASNVYYPKRIYNEKYAKEKQGRPMRNKQNNEFSYQSNDYSDFLPDNSFKPLYRGSNKRFQQTNTLLAFTLNGIPLKLKFGPKVQNPIEYLHETLDSAGVSLNIPIVSYNIIEAVGTEILQLGYVRNENDTMAALLVDLSDPRQLKDLLKALRKIQRTIS